MPVPLIRPAPPRKKAHAIATSCAVTGRLADEAAREVSWQVPEEMPVAIMYNSRSYAVMMATPADLNDLGIGFTLSEGFVRDVGEIKGVIAMAVENGHCVDISVDDEKLRMRKPPDRALEGRP